MLHTCYCIVNSLIKYNSTGCCFYFMTFIVSYRNFGMQFDNASFVSSNGIFKIHKTAFCIFIFFRAYSKVIYTKYHILRRCNNGLSGCRCKDVICRKHQHSCFSLSFY